MKHNKIIAQAYSPPYAEWHHLDLSASSYMKRIAISIIIHQGPLQFKLTSNLFLLCIIVSVLQLEMMKGVRNFMVRLR